MNYANLVVLKYSRNKVLIISANFPSWKKQNEVYKKRHKIKQKPEENRRKYLTYISPAGRLPPLIVGRPLGSNNLSTEKFQN